MVNPKVIYTQDMVGFKGILLKEVVNIDFIVEVIEGGWF